MSNEREKQNNSVVNSVPALFEQLGIGHVGQKDRFSLTYRDGIMEVSVKRESGQTETVTKSVDMNGSGFSQIRAFDPNQMEKKDRDSLIRKMKGKGDTQESLAKVFGLSQPMICKIVNSRS